jgi:hypothetical protein
VDISEQGARLAVPRADVQQKTGTFQLPETGLSLPFEVRKSETIGGKTFLNVKFRLAAGTAERFSLSIALVTQKANLAA